MKQSMKAMQLFDLGHKLKLVDVPIPVPTGNEIQIKIEAVGINFADLLICEGKYQVRPELPFSPGMEVCGIVTDLGPECQGFQKGDRIVGFGNYGGLAEYITLHQNQCLQISNKLADVEAAGFMVAYGTSHVALSHRAQINFRRKPACFGCIRRCWKNCR